MPGCEIIRVSSLILRHEHKLIGAYAEECSIPEIGKIDPQWETYEKMELAGVFQVFAAYFGGNMVGFGAVVCAVLPHYGVKAATIESLFVLERYRSYGAGTDLMRAIRLYALATGCKAILTSAPIGGPLEALLGRRNVRTNSVFCESLDASGIAFEHRRLRALDDGKCTE